MKQTVEKPQFCKIQNQAPQPRLDFTMQRPFGIVELFVPALLAVLQSAAAPANWLWAEDTVQITTGDAGRGRTKLSGEVLDYTGKELKIKLTSGQQKLVPSDRVVLIETKHTAEERGGDEAFEQGRFAEAAGLYEKAIKTETRTWARRRIVAQLVWSLRSSGKEASAGEYFLILAKSDPATQFFDCIPLAWQPGTPSVELEQKCRRWLEQDAQPAAVLLGASHLLLAAQGTSAATKLQQLAETGEQRIALLARAQLWRRQTATADDRALVEWRATIDRLPEPLRAGPLFVLGKALAQQKQYEAAALELLRLPILYPRDRALAARALLEAGRSLDKIDQTAEAARLYREAVAQYPGDTAATEAQQLLKPITERKN